jgi:hypothetical protein
MYYVNDGLVAAKNALEADALEDLVGSMFEIRKLGEPQDLLRIHTCRDQEDKAEALAAEVGVQNGADVTRGVWGVEGGTTRGAHDRQAVVPAGDRQPVASSTVHTAEYCAVCCCISGILAGAECPAFAVLLDVGGYVGGTASSGITYGRKGHPLGFWCDANFAACSDTRRSSTTGWVVTMYGGAMSWSSKKQATAAASTIDAEYQACGAAAREGRWPCFRRTSHWVGGG